jgi:hypothetical protein
MGVLFFSAHYHRSAEALLNWSSFFICFHSFCSPAHFRFHLSVLPTRDLFSHSTTMSFSPFPAGRRIAYSARTVTARAGPADDFVFTWKNGKRISDFRDCWANACCAAGLGNLFCPSCQSVAKPHETCSRCRQTWKRNQLNYRGLISMTFAALLLGT